MGTNQYSVHIFLHTQSLFDFFLSVNLLPPYIAVKWGAHLLQAEAHDLGALYGVDELALAHRLLYDVTKVFKILQETRYDKMSMHFNCKCLTVQIIHAVHVMDACFSRCSPWLIFCTSLVPKQILSPSSTFHTSSSILISFSSLSKSS